MLDMNLQSFASQDRIPIPNGLPDKPGPKLVSAKGKVEHLVVVLEYGEDLYAQTEKVLNDGNVPMLIAGGTALTWSSKGYIGFVPGSGTKLSVGVVRFDEQKAPVIAKYKISTELPSE